MNEDEEDVKTTRGWECRSKCGRDESAKKSQLFIEFAIGFGLCQFDNFPIGAQN